MFVLITLDLNDTSSITIMQVFRTTLCARALQRLTAEAYNRLRVSFHQQRTLYGYYLIKSIRSRFLMCWIVIRCPNLGIILYKYFNNCQLIIYTNENPENGQVNFGRLWVKSVCPWSEGQFGHDWLEIVG